MAGLSGADAEELERLGQHMLQAADRLETIRGEIGAAFGRANWQGEDAQHFHDLWQHRLSGQLQLAMAATREASARLARNAREQRAASALDAAGTSGGPVRFTGGLGDPGAVEEWDLFGSAFDLAGGVGDLLAGIGGIRALGKLGDAFEAAGRVGKPFGYAGDVLDVIHLGTAIYSGDARETKIAAVDVTADAIFTGAALAATGFPPAEILVAAADIGWGFVPDDAKVAAADAVIDAGHEVVEAAGHVANAVGDVGEAVGGLAEGGFNGVKHFIGW